MKLSNNLDLKNLNKMFSNGGRYARWRILSMIIVGIMAASALLTANFIYQNIYVTLSNANIIIVLSSNLSVDTIDLKNYNLAEERTRYKTESFSWSDKIRNIFNYEVSGTTTTKL